MQGSTGPFRLHATTHTAAFHYSNPRMVIKQHRTKQEGLIQWIVALHRHQGNRWPPHGYNAHIVLATLGSREAFKARGYGMFPHLPNTYILRFILRSSLSTLLHTFPKPPMAHFNYTDANCHSTSTPARTSHRLYRPPVFEYSSVDTPEISTYDGSAHGQRYPTSALRCTLRPEESPRKCNHNPLKRHCLTYISPESASPGTSNQNRSRTQGDTQIVSSKRFWSVVGPCDKARSSSVPSREGPPDSVAASEHLIATPTRRDYECRPPASALIWVGAQTR